MVARARAGEVLFLGAFAVYTAVALFMLALGIGAALAVDPGIRATFESWAAAGGVSGPYWLAIASAARLSAPLPAIVLDYALSALNIGCGVFLVWKRPNDWVARLLGIALIGTAMGYNYQSHSVVAVAAAQAQVGGVPAVRYLNIFHWLFHALGGVAFVHGLLIFPNGRLVPRRLMWFLVVLYAVMIEELLYPVYNNITGTVTNPSLIVLVFNQLFNISGILRSFDNIIQAEVVFFVLLFGVLVPVVGVGAQLYRYRRTSSELERRQTRLVLWALTASFSAALVFMAVGAVGLAASGTVFTKPSSVLLEQILLRVTPPLYAVLPVALLIAILRYRLLDIEVIVDRTLIYGPLTAVLALAFLATLFVLQQILKALIGQPSELAIALAAFVNIWLFQPLRRRVQRFIDTRFAIGPPRRTPAGGPSGQAAARTRSGS